MSVHISAEWWDFLVLGLLAFFFAYAGFLLKRETRLGWSMFTVFGVLAVLWVYGIVLRVHPELRHQQWLGGVIRAVLMVPVAWAIWELRRMQVKNGNE